MREIISLNNRTVRFVVYKNLSLEKNM